MLRCGVSGMEDETNSRDGSDVSLDPLAQTLEPWHLCDTPTSDNLIEHIQ